MNNPYNRNGGSQPNRSSNQPSYSGGNGQPLRKKKRKKKKGYATSQFFLQMLIIVLVILVLLAAYLIHTSNTNPGSEITVRDTDTEPASENPSSTRARETVEPPDIVTDIPVIQNKDPIENNKLYDGFELPIGGSTGYVSVETKLLEQPYTESADLLTLNPGDVFMIVDENASHTWVRIKVGKLVGYIPETRCWVNLPDVIPSAVYDDTNSYASIFRTSGFEIPGVTGKQLYQARAYNARLGRDEFIMPILIPAARKLCAAQQTALKLGRTLVIYEAYRPRETQIKVANAVSALAKKNSTIYKGLYDKENGWSISWFIATSLSNHQMGFAVDTSLGEVSDYETAKVGKYSFYRVTEYNPCKMPSPMHELSIRSINYVHSYSSTNPVGWESVGLAPTMTNDAKLLQYICTSAGMTPLASEWWHFNDLNTYTLVRSLNHTGEFTTSVCVSALPD